MPGCQGFGHEQVDNVSSFRMQHGQQSMFPGDTHDPENIPIAQAHVGIGHEDFYTGNAFLLQSRDFFFDLAVQAGNIHVETKINRGNSICHGVPPVNISGQRARVRAPQNQWRSSSRQKPPPDDR